VNQEAGTARFRVNAGTLPDRQTERSKPARNVILALVAVLGPEPRRPIEDRSPEDVWLMKTQVRMSVSKRRRRNRSVFGSVRTMTLHERRLIVPARADVSIASIASESRAKTGRRDRAAVDVLPKDDGAPPANAERRYLVVPIGPPVDVAVRVRARLIDAWITQSGQQFAGIDAPVGPAIVSMLEDLAVLGISRQRNAAEEKRNKNDARDHDGLPYA
jgi:hypothetical protein